MDATNLNQSVNVVITANDSTTRSRRQIGCASTGAGFGPGRVIWTGSSAASPVRYDFSDIECITPGAGCYDDPYGGTKYLVELASAGLNDEEEGRAWEITGADCGSGEGKGDSSIKRRRRRSEATGRSGSNGNGGNTNSLSFRSFVVCPGFVDTPVAPPLIQTVAGPFLAIMGYWFPKTFPR